jgi:antitoxin CptB
MEVRRKKLLFRAQHCGMKENDFLLGRFAAAHVETMSEPDLAAFEALLKEPDNDLYNWITLKQPLPTKHDTPLMAALIEFNTPK